MTIYKTRRREQRGERDGLGRDIDRSGNRVPFRYEINCRSVSDAERTREGCPVYDTLTGEVAVEETSRLL